MPTLLYQGGYRSAKAPADGVPLGVRSAARCKFSPPFISEQKIMTVIQMFWCISGSGIIEINGRPHVLGRNQVSFYFPGMFHKWYAKNGKWCFLYLTLDGALAETIVTGFGLESKIYDCSPPPIKLFDLLFRVMRKQTRQSELQASAIAYKILARASATRSHTADKIAHEAAKLIQNKWQCPDMNVKTLAAELSVRSVELCLHFRQATGISPAAYMKRLRVQNAINMLRYSTRHIKDIAFRCGYSDPNYFSRLIREITGNTPKEIRCHYRNINPA